MTSTEFVTTSEKTSLPPTTKYKKVVAFAAMVAVAAIGAKSLLTDKTEQTPLKPDVGNVQEYCRWLVNDPEIHNEFSEKLTGVTISPDACVYRDEPNKQSTASWLDPTVKSEITLSITSRAINQTIRCPEIGNYKEIPALPGTELTCMSQRGAGTVIMYYPDYSISISSGKPVDSLGFADIIANNS